MKALIISEPGEASVLQIREVARPDPGDGEVLIRVHATAVNRADCLQRRGLYPPPAGVTGIPGLEVSGEIVGLGRACKRFETGQQVFALLAGGGYAEYVCVAETAVLPVPQGVSLTETAAIAEVFLTAFHALNWLAQISSGDTVLIHAGASGVGTAAIQLARLGGAEVLVTAGSADKLERCMELGARAGCNHHDADFAEFVSSETDGHGADVIIDFIGAAYFERNLSALAMDGRWVLLGLMGGSKVANLNLGRLLAKRAQLLSSTLRNRSESFKADLVRDFGEQCLPKFSTGELRPVIDRVLSWKEAAEAHRLLESNQTIGKIVLELD